MTLEETPTSTDDSYVTSTTSGGAWASFLFDPPQAVTIVSDEIYTQTATDLETLTDYITSTVWDQSPTVTITAAPSPTTATVTDTVMVSQTFIATAGSFWTTPPQFSDLESFKVSHFADGQSNLQVANSLPPNLTGDVLGLDLPALESVNDLPTSLDFVDDSPTVPSDSVLQIFYPAKSVDPAQDPVGGADFYATPLPLDNANNVTLQYSVYFPPDFNWMQGGKLPGLYGGHMQCSGGNDATSCFSTRLMWRGGGKGELYLVCNFCRVPLIVLMLLQYAPKDKQTTSLCHTPPQSLCDAAYGLSIGRGSFNFTAGNWTQVRQTVVLNTPGEQNGGFKLEVNGQPIMDVNDVFYRDVPPLPSTTTSSSIVYASPTSSEGGLLGPILGTAPIRGSAPILGSAPI